MQQIGTGSSKDDWEGSDCPHTWRYLGQRYRQVPVSPEAQARWDEMSARYPAYFNFPPTAGIHVDVFFCSRCLMYREKELTP